MTYIRENHTPETLKKVGSLGSLNPKPYMLQAVVLQQLALESPEALTAPPVVASHSRHVILT